MLVECCLKLVANRFDVAFSLNGCGSILSHFCLFKVAVARVWRSSVYSKWLWLEPGAFPSFQNGFGSSLKYVRLRRGVNTVA